MHQTQSIAAKRQVTNYRSDRKQASARIGGHATETEAGAFFLSLVSRGDCSPVQGGATYGFSCFEKFRMPAIDPQQTLMSLFETALSAVNPLTCLPPHLPSISSLPADGKLIVIGAGKAAGAMAQAAWAHYGSRITHGCVVTRYGHGADAGCIEVIEAAHPVPDAAGEQAANRILDCVADLSDKDTVIALMSGGASALLARPAAGLTLADKQGINRALLKSGATIHEMNTVRKHLSGIKGGRLAQACMPARLMTFVISDVPSDDPSTVGSGPTLVNHSTAQDALAILMRYGIDAPPSVMQHLQSAACATPVFDDAQRARMSVKVIATARTALQAAANRARAMGLNVWLLSDNIEGQARDIGCMHAALALETARGEGPLTAPCVLLSGGETTVTVKGNGRGGRNAEFLLGFADALGKSGIAHAGASISPSISALACDTDGIDGVEDNAGAWFETGDMQRAAHLNLRTTVFLDNNDAWTYFNALGRLIKTGPTRTNVNDFRAVLVMP